MDNKTAIQCAIDFFPIVGDRDFIIRSFNLSPNQVVILDKAIKDKEQERGSNGNRADTNHRR